MSTLFGETIAHRDSRPMPVTADIRSDATSHLLFVDNIRALLTTPVILFHPMIT